MSDISVKIFMCTHKEYTILPPLCVAVQGGAALHPPVKGALSDVGARGSLSEKNPEYCELTVQYYAWRNEEADVYGFCHYRRFFSFGKNGKRPYTVYGDFPENKHYMLGESEGICALAKQYDIILPHPEDMRVSAYDYYRDAPYAYAEDMDLFLGIISERAPELMPFAEQYLGGRKQYFCNMFLMKRELFFKYSELLFDLLSEFDKRKTLHGAFQADRTDGYLAERFLGIFVLYAASLGASIHTVPRIDVCAPLSKRILYLIFPPESRRRFFFKRLKSRKNKNESATS